MKLNSYVCETETSFLGNVHAKEFVMLPICRAQNL